MNLKKILVAVIIIMFLLTACGKQPSAEEQDIKTPCEYTLKYVVTDMNGEDIQLAEVKTQYQIVSQKSEYFQEYDNYLFFEENAFGETEYNLGRKISNFNNLIAPYFGGDITSGVDLVQSLRYDQALGAFSTSEPLQCREAGDTLHTSLSEGAGHGDYPVNTRFYDGRIYVTATSPKGSTVSYSFPQAVINQYINHFFKGAASVVFPSGSNVVSNEVTADSDTFTMNMLQSLIGNGNSIEAVYFSFTADDMEGRRILKPLIARALAITSGESPDTKYVAVLNGYNYTGQKSVTSLTLENHGTSVRSYGFRRGFSVDGAETNMNYNTESTMEDMVSGSIYLVPLQ